MRPCGTETTWIMFVVLAISSVFLHHVHAGDSIQIDPELREGALQWIRKCREKDRKDPNYTPSEEEIVLAVEEMDGEDVKAEITKQFESHSSPVGGTQSVLGNIFGRGAPELAPQRDEHQFRQINEELKRLKTQRKELNSTKEKLERENNELRTNVTSLQTQLQLETLGQTPATIVARDGSMSAEMEELKRRNKAKEKELEALCRKFHTLIASTIASIVAIIVSIIIYCWCKRIKWRKKSGGDEAIYRI